MLDKAEKAKQKHKKQMKKAKKRIHVLFEKCDKYGHGNLDADDIKRMVKKVKVYKPDDDLPFEDEISKAIRMMGDMDNTKTIDEEEFTEFVARHLDMSKKGTRGYRERISIHETLRQFFAGHSFMATRGADTIEQSPVEGKRSEKSAQIGEEA